MLISIVLIAIFAIGAVSAADENITDTADEILSAEPSDEVLSTEPTDDLEVSQPEDFSELVGLIKNTSSGQTLTLEKDYINDGTYTKGILISKKMTIDGQGHTLDANNKSNIFRISNNQVALKNINFINAKSADYSTIYGNCTVINCSFTECSSGNYGGALNQGDAYNCYFEYCSAPCGGAIYNGNAYNCTFAGCLASESTTSPSDVTDFSGYGGAIYQGNAYNCSFIECVSVDGGAIYQGNAYNSYFEECFTINWDWTVGAGGGIYQGDAYNCSFVGCNAFSGGAIYNGNTYNSSFISCWAQEGPSIGGMGGAIGKGNAYDCSFTDCFADDGCAIYWGDAHNCYFIECSPATKYDAIVDEGNAYDSTFINCTVKKGGIYVTGNMTNCTFLPLTLSSSNLTVNYGEGKKLPVRLIDGKGDNVDGTTVDVKIYKNNKLINSFSTKSGADLPIDAAPGNYIIALTCNNASPLNVSLIVNKGSPKLALANDFAKSGETANVKVTMSKKATGFVRITINGVTYREQINSGVASVDVANLADGAYDVKVVYAGNTYHTAETITSTFHVGKFAQGIELATKNIKAAETVRLTANLGKDATGFLRFVIGDETYKAQIKDSIAYADISGLKEGSYSVTLKYGGNYKYHAETLSEPINIYKSSPEMDVTITKLNSETRRIKVNLANDATGNVLITANGVSYNIKISNGVASVDVPYDLGSALVAKYNGNAYYNAESKTITQPTYGGYANSPELKLIAENINVGETERLTANLNKNMAGFVRFIIGGETYKVQIKNGAAYTDIDGLKAGSYEVTLKYGGSMQGYNGEALTKTIYVFKSSPEISMTVNDINVGQNAITVNLAKDAPGNVQITINGETQKVKINDGMATLDISNLKAGTYDISVKYGGNYKYDAETRTTSFNVSKSSPELKVFKTTVDGKTVLTANIAKDASGNINFVVNGNTYKAKITNGVATLTLPDMAPGTYTLKSTYNGNYKYLAETKTRSITIK